jgi:chromosome segregation ATPase
MRLIIEIVIIVGLAGLVLFLFGDNSELNKELQETKQRQEQAEKKVGVLQKAITDSSYVIDSLRKEKEKYEKRIVDINQDLKETEQYYKNEIEKVYGAKLSELIDSTQEIIKVKNDTYVVVTEAFYRKARANEFKIEKLKMKTRLLSYKVAIQDSIIDVQYGEIINMMGQLANYKHQIHLKDTVIMDKDIEIGLLEKKIKKVKWQRNITIGAAGGIILLILL